MKKVTLSAVAALFAIGVAFAGSVSQQGFYLWDDASQSIVKRTQAPSQAEIDAVCDGVNQDCYYTLDETGTVKNAIDFRL